MESNLLYVSLFCQTFLKFKVYYIQHASTKRNPGHRRSHELVEQTKISELKSLEKLFPVKKIDVFAG